jgi:hypothetical protein
MRSLVTIVAVEKQQVLQCVCVCVCPSVIQYAMRMHHIVMYGLYSCTVFFDIVS